MIDKIRDRVISLSASLLDAMKLMDKIKVKMLFVFEGEQFEGIFTIGDIQRAIIKSTSLNSPVSAIVDKNKKYAYIRRFSFARFGVAWCILRRLGLTRFAYQRF